MDDKNHQPPQQDSGPPLPHAPGTVFSPQSINSEAQSVNPPQQENLIQPQQQIATPIEQSSQVPPQTDIHTGLTEVQSPQASSRPKKSHLKLFFIVIFGLASLFLIFFYLVLPKLVTKNAVNHAFDSQKKAQQQAGPVQYKLALQPVKFGTITAASIKLPESWTVEQRPEASTVVATGPIDYVNGLTPPTINATEESSYRGKIDTDISSYKSLHSKDQLISEKASIIAGLPATTLEYKIANTLGLKVGETPKNFNHTFTIFIDNSSVLYTINTLCDERQNDVLGPFFSQAIQSFTYK